MDYSEIGKIVKQNYPDEYGEYDDHDLGLAYAVNYLSTVEIPDAPSPARILPSFQHSYHQHQLEDFGAQVSLQSAKMNHRADMIQSVVNTAHHLSNLPAQLHEETTLRKATHAKALTATDAERQLTQMALNKGLTVDAYLRFLAEELMVKNTVETAKGLAQVQSTTAKELADIEVEKYRTMKEIDLDIRIRAFKAKQEMNGLSGQAVSGEDVG